MPASRFCVKLSDDFAVDDPDVDIQKGMDVVTLWPCTTTNSSCKHRQRIILLFNP